ncbi:MAG: tRNA uridine-5-carboxymethylaminomethyl(34) synthesis GTPase MnmE [Kiritimatiellae bacterium]|nr:tRNA uridine-5-carboxymethylaminomethyl(34) synthesis GTPase MnmE [Kiritimatiellia bacterium]
MKINSFVEAFPFGAAGSPAGVAATTARPTTDAKMEHLRRIVRHVSLSRPTLDSKPNCDNRANMMRACADTIAAIATAPGAAGIAIVRVSGPAALSVADRMFRCRGAPPSQRPTHTIVHGRVCGPADETLDEALLLVMRAPHSYTGEDVVEFQCHGGSVPAARILRRAIEVGCRVAEPGEFTKRAFLNGRLDLTQAEGVLRLIEASTERAADVALRLLQGSLGREINRIYEAVVSAAASLDASLDFPEEDIPENVAESAQDTIRDALGSCARLISSWRYGKALGEGFRVVIAGRPNAGKSTLFNMLAEQNRAIVSHLPGTTRDTIEHWTQIRGFPVCLVDTAGFTETACPVESEGVLRAKLEADRADLILFCLPCNDLEDNSARDVLNSLPAEKIAVVLTKSDLCAPGQIDSIKFPCAQTSICDPKGSADRVRDLISSRILDMQRSVESCDAVVSERHRCCLEDARAALGQALSLLESGRPDAVVLASELMKQAAESVARINGRIYDSDLLDEIFSRFCIGK